MMKKADMLTATPRSRCTEVDQSGQPCPTEDPESDECGLEEERDQPSIASGAPNTSPTNREYSLQFMPNWNSCTMPVATRWRS